jgi:glycosyltransferase involved in cell wall biosynthesis
MLLLSQFHPAAAFWNECARSEVLSPRARVSGQRKDASMKIAQIAPLMESVPPRQYGGTERVVSYLTEELVRLGHDVTLFASGDSTTSARLLPFCDTALRLDSRIKDPAPHHIVMLDAVREMAHEFDVLHFHVDVLHYPLIRDFVDRTVTTLHGRLDMPESRRLYSVFSGAPLVSVSFDQRRPMPPVNWAGMVYHGLPRHLLPFNPAPRGGYLAFLGRISPEKRPDRAIEIATRVGARLMIAAKIDRVDQDYWTRRIKPMVDANPRVEFIGEIGERQKARFLGEATALLFPIDWPEPFGMVMIESMSCGTPVIAFRRGSAPEIIDDARSGFLVENVDEAVAAAQRVGDLDRRAVRASFEARFTAERLARDYLYIYRSLPGVRMKSRRMRTGVLSEFDRPALRATSFRSS